MRPAPRAWVSDLLRWPTARGDGLSISALSALSAGATVASPALLAHPLLLVALTPRLPFLLLASGRSPLLVFLLVGGARLCAADVSWYRIGRRLGPAALDRVPVRCRRLVAGAPRVRDATLLTAVLIRPVGRHLAAAGAVGISPLVVGVVDVIGTLGFLLALRAGAASFLG